MAHMVTVIMVLILGLCVTTEDTKVCIFGQDQDDCYFQCKCQSSRCSGSESHCEDCHNVTGVCTEGKGQEACLEDEFSNNLYEARYWSGSGCQTGNIAYRQDILDENNIPTLLETTDGSIDSYSDSTIQLGKFMVTMHFPSDYKVEFIDIFEDKYEFNTNGPLFSILLETNDGTNYPCERGTSGTNRLKPSISKNYRRIHYTCQAPSIGKKIHINSEETASFHFIYIHEFVVIGYKHAEIEETRCLKTEGNYELKWCSQCRDSYPPECRQDCPTGISGINCEGDSRTESTTSDILRTSSETSRKSSETSRIPVIIGVVLGLIVITTIIIVTIIVAYRIHSKKSPATPEHGSRELSVTQNVDNSVNSEFTEEVRTVPQSVHLPSVASGRLPPRRPPPVSQTRTDGIPGDGTQMTIPQRKDRTGRASNNTSMEVVIEQDQEIAEGSSESELRHSGCDTDKDSDDENGGYEKHNHPYESPLREPTAIVNTVYTDLL